MLHRFLLVGVLVTVEQGSLEQLAYGTLVALLFLVVQLFASPFKKFTDECTAAACSMLLVVLFFLAIYYKVGALTQFDKVQHAMSEELQAVYLVEHITVSGIFFSMSVGGMVVLAAIAVVNFRQFVKVQLMANGLAKAWEELGPLLEERAKAQSGKQGSKLVGETGHLHYGSPEVFRGGLAELLPNGLHRSMEQEFTRWLPQPRRGYRYA